MSYQEKHPLLPTTTAPPASNRRRYLWLAVLLLLALHHLCSSRSNHSASEWGSFPRTDDPFHFLPCTNTTLPPPLDDPNPLALWTSLFDPDRTHWSFGNSSGLYLCGYLDVPLDYTSPSDPRIARLAVTKLQHSPIASNRTLIVEPGGPGGSGTNLVWRKAEKDSRMFTDSTWDVLGWDPRGVNASQPSISCFPYDADRDRFASTFLRDSPSPLHELLKTDSLNQAIFSACSRKYGDVATMLTTAFVARDLDEIRKALRSEHVDGYFVSYGTGIGQTYANMFPDKVGRLMLDGTEYVRDQRLIGGFGWAALDNITAAFEDGFLGECVDAGPDRCSLAKPLPGSTELPTKSDLISTFDQLFTNLTLRPLPGWTENSGPLIITYTSIISLIYTSLYAASTWPPLASAFHDLLQGNTSAISQYVDDSWEFDPHFPARHSSDELGMLVICSDQWDSPLPATYDVATNGEQWYLDLWKRMVSQSEIGGNGRFFDILPCRHWNATFGPPKEVYRGALNHTLSHPVLLIAETYDPATPLRNGRRLLDEMGDGNARLIALDAFSHSSRDLSKCAMDIMRRYMLTGALPDERETGCKADHRPYRDVEAHSWKDYIAELRSLSPNLVKRYR
ncbi:proteinase [Pseudozyma hubeiensis SY62]|uniref:Proteinase n=1 Tax=Pseudozyma hubeiensis (strain SY62) TaxID=1305764 RepID=R9NY76_PSEHS|nr:proteinase [Pseudozyma hubeiensis SY62]GAC93601.1 proteinase [Pseudozyma hubeiensis SY62]